MKTIRRTLLATLAATTVGFAGSALAQEGTQDDFMLIFKMAKMDANKDGMVSKKEFMSTIDKAYDMKAKSMGAKGGMLTEAQMRDLLKSLYTGG